MNDHSQKTLIQPKPKMRLLAIDDEEACAAWLEILFKHVGYTVKKADTAARALEVFEVWHPDIVILDTIFPEREGVDFPEGKGVDLLGKFRAIDRRTPVVMISCGAGEAQAMEAMEGGAFAFLKKPVDPQLLLDTADKALKEREATR